MCDQLGVARSTCYAWRNRTETPTAGRRRELAEHVQRVFDESRQTFGCRRVAAQFNRDRHECSVGLVADLMRELGLTAVQPRAYKRTTIPGEEPLDSPDLIGRDFDPASSAPGERLVGDITYLKTGEGWLYLATVIQKIESARANRRASARQFAAQRDLSRQAGKYLAAAVDAEPGLDLSLIDQFPPKMREAAAAILPRAAHGPDHAPAARAHLTAAVRLASRGRHQEAARWLAEARRDINRADERRSRAEERRAVERAQAARSVECPCQAGRGVPCGPSGDHLARYLRAEQRGTISRESLTDLIAGLNVIAPDVTIQPPAEHVLPAADATATDHLPPQRIDARMPGTREALAAPMLAGRLDQPTATLGPSHCGHDGAACDAREAPELETGA
jgi:hypothetical protein